MQLPMDTEIYCGHEYTRSNARFALFLDCNNQALVNRAQDVDRLRRENKPTLPTRLDRELETNPFLRPTSPPSEPSSECCTRPTGTCSPPSASARTRAGSTSMADLTAEDVIRLLELKPHPEGGHVARRFATTRRGCARPLDGDHFLLARGEVSRWHRVDAAEVSRHWHAGAPLALSIAPPDGDAVEIRVGVDLQAGERPRAPCLPGYWRSAVSLGDYNPRRLHGGTGLPVRKFRADEEDFLRRGDRGVRLALAGLLPAKPRYGFPPFNCRRAIG